MNWRIICLGLSCLINTWYAVYGQPIDTVKIHAIFDELKEVSGRVQTLKDPELRIETDSQYAAFMDRSTYLPVIGLDEKAIRVCMEFGDRSEDAIAGLLAHELVHFYKDHDNKKFYLNGELSAMRLREMEEEEKQADSVGLFLAMAAGYQAGDIMDSVLIRLYEAYDIPNELTGYPSLNDRCKNIQRCADHANLLWGMFDMANACTILNLFQEAASLYGYISNTFQSREIFNNAGVSYLLHALPQAHAAVHGGRMAYAYPIGLDPQTRLESTKSVSDVPLDWEKALEMGQQALKASIAFEETYIPAYIHLAATYDVGGELEEAKDYARKAMRVSHQQNQKKLLADAALMMGIIWAHEGRKDSAETYFAVAKKSGDKLTRDKVGINLQLLADPNADFHTSRYKSKPPLPREQIERLDLKAFDKKRSFDRLTRFRIEWRKTVFAIDERESSRIYILGIEQENGEKAWMYLHQTLPGYELSSLQGIRLGAGNTQIRKAYKREPDKELGTPNGYFQLFSDANLILRFGQENKLEAWMTYYFSSN